MTTARRSAKALNGLRPDRRRMYEENPSLLGLEYEAHEPVCGNYTHADAVAICARLSNLYRRSWPLMSSIAVDHHAIIDALTERKIPFVLTGMYGIVSWIGRPRATHDVDILVKGGRNYARAVKAVRELYPDLELHRHVGVTGFYAPGESLSLIDVTYPHRVDIQTTLETAIWSEEAGRRYRIPTLEAALANKYGAMLALTRDPLKRGQDALDFAMMVRHSTDPGRAPIDIERLAAIAATIWDGGGEEIIRMVEDAKAGKIPNPLR